ncbi:MAG TPA: PH domain-containing protein [Patescibacteria group bacterium]|nr:PH domain-containing protein [Patescibacteria group bacterium]
MRDFTKYHFKGQENNERVLLVLHRHWFDILSQFLLIISMLFLLFGSFIVLPRVFPNIINNINQTFFYFIENLFFMLTWMMLYLIWVDYYFDVWIVTDNRIVNIEQKGLFSRTVSELELEKIQDITTDVKGVIPTFLNYGDLQVQTAAEEERFLFHNIPDPYEVKNLIMNLHRNSEKREENQFGEMLKNKIYHENNE